MVAISGWSRVLNGELLLGGGSCGCGRLPGDLLTFKVARVPLALRPFALFVAEVCPEASFVSMAAVGPLCQALRVPEVTAYGPAGAECVHTISWMVLISAVAALVMRSASPAPAAISPPRRSVKTIPSEADGRPILPAHVLRRKSQLRRDSLSEYRVPYLGCTQSREQDGPWTCLTLMAGCWMTTSGSRDPLRRYERTISRQALIESTPPTTSGPTR
jgi:hypothetical protein